MAEGIIKIQTLQKGVVSVSSCTASNGTVDSGDIHYAYNDEYVFMYARINMANVSNNTRPELTIPIPATIPSFRGYGSATIRGSGTNIVISDNAYIYHDKGNAFAMGGFNWYIGLAPAGNLTYCIPAVVPL